MARLVATAMLLTSLSAAPAVQAQEAPEACPGEVVVLFGALSARACGVAWCETGGTYDNDLIGRAGEVSIFQIHPVHFAKYSRQRLRDDVEYASEVAYEMSAGGRDWSAWSCG